MPFKPSTAKKYARLILQWMLPTAFALIVLNGAYSFIFHYNVTAQMTVQSVFTETNKYGVDYKRALLCTDSGVCVGKSLSDDEYELLNKGDRVEHTDNIIRLSPFWLATYYMVSVVVVFASLFTLCVWLLGKLIAWVYKD